MIEGIIGKKLGMTQIVKDDGEVVPVTILKAGPCVIVQKKNVDNDGYEAIQLGLVEDKAIRKMTKPMKGHFEERGIKQPVKILREFHYKNEKELEEGKEITVDIFSDVKKVNIVGISKGKGFQGVMKRHGFSGQGKSHGSKIHRATGSIGQATYPGKVMRGKAMPGHMGNERVIVKNLKIEKIMKEETLILVRGAVPGPKGGTILIKNSEFKRG